MTNTEGEIESMVVNTLGERKEKCSVMPGSLELDLRRVWEETDSLSGLYMSTICE